MDVASSWDALCAVNGTGMFTPKFQDSRISLTCLVEIYYGMHRRAHECTLEIDLRAKACRPARPSCPDATDRCAKSRCNSVRRYRYIYTYALLYTRLPPRVVLPLSWHLVTFLQFLLLLGCGALCKFVRLANAIKETEVHTKIRLIFLNASRVLYLSDFCTLRCV